MAQQKHTARVTQGGRIIIPAHLRKKLNLQEGSIVCLEVHDRELRLIPVTRRIRLAKSLCKPYLKGSTQSWVDSLLRDRRTEAESEVNGS